LATFGEDLNHLQRSRQALRATARSPQSVGRHQSWIARICSRRRGEFDLEGSHRLILRGVLPALALPECPCRLENPLRAIERCVQPCPIFIVKVVPLIHGTRSTTVPSGRFTGCRAPSGPSFTVARSACVTQKGYHTTKAAGQAKAGLARRASGSTLIAENIGEEIACWAVTTIRWTLRWMASIDRGGWTRRSSVGH